MNKKIDFTIKNNKTVQINDILYLYLELTSYERKKNNFNFTKDTYKITKFLYNKERLEKIEPLLNVELTCEVLNYNKTLKTKLNNYYKNKPIDNTIYSLVSYIRKIDLLAYHMKGKYNLSSQTICYYINNYLINNDIMDLGCNFKFEDKIIDKKDIKDYIRIDITGLFEKIFANEIIKYLKENKKYNKLLQYCYGDLHEWILYDFTKAYGSDEVTKFLIHNKNTKTEKEVLYKDIIKLIKKRVNY